MSSSSESVAASGDDTCTVGDPFRSRRCGVTNVLQRYMSGITLNHPNFELWSMQQHSARCTGCILNGVVHARGIDERGLRSIAWAHSRWTIRVQQADVLPVWPAVGWHSGVTMVLRSLSLNFNYSTDHYFENISSYAGNVRVFEPWLTSAVLPLLWFSLSGSPELVKGSASRPANAQRRENTGDHICSVTAGWFLDLGNSVCAYSRVCCRGFGESRLDCYPSARTCWAAYATTGLRILRLVASWTAFRWTCGCSGASTAGVGLACFDQALATGRDDAKDVIQVNAEAHKK